MTEQPHGLARGLTNYGDADFSLYLRRSNSVTDCILALIGDL